MIWIVLGAIINPNAFLPYATAIVSWVTACLDKYYHFDKLIKEGLASVKEYVKKFFCEHIGNVIKKMDLNQGESSSIISDVT